MYPFLALIIEKTPYAIAYIPIRIMITRVLSKGFNIMINPISTDIMPIIIWKGFMIDGRLNLK